MQSVIRRAAYVAAIAIAGILANPASAALSLVSSPFTGTQPSYVFNAANQIPLTTTHFSLEKVGAAGSILPGFNGLIVGPLFGSAVSFKVTLAEPATQLGFATGGFIGDTTVLMAVTLSNGDALAAPETLAIGNAFVGVADDVPFTTATFTFKSTSQVQTANSVTLKDFRFVTAPVVPEPAAIGLFAGTVGGGLLLRRRSGAGQRRE